MSFQLKESPSTPHSSCGGFLKILYIPEGKWTLISREGEREFVSQMIQKSFALETDSLG